ncbi:LysR family transcriptional regulator [Bradyrhizobium sp. LA2.1]|uniref:LysR family transcriptional regulator n=1 Tax=Bradyrhizobium sp. LA2.1 TaxID=3156376 RepID=UPI0033979F00
MTHVSLRQLDVFIQVARAGSLSKAAALLELAPSLISRTIGQIEESWGGALFHRTGRGFVLSEFGIQMLPNAITLLDQSAELNNLARQSSKVPSGVVRLGIIPSLATNVMSMLRADLQSSAPEIRLIVREGLNGHIDEWLTAGSIDMAVINRFSIARNQDEYSLGELETFVVCSPTNRLALSSTVNFAELAGVPLVLPHFQNGLRSVLDYHARKQDISLTVAIEAESISVMKHVAMLGDAVAILPVCSVWEEVKAGKLSIVKITNPAICRQINLASAQPKSMSLATKFILSRLRELIPPLVKQLALH